MEKTIKEVKIFLKIIFLFALFFSSVQKCLATKSTSEWDYTITNGEVKFLRYYGVDTTVKIPSVFKNYPVTSLGNCIFYNCDRVTTVTIPSSIKALNDDTFKYATNLSKIKVDNLNITFCPIDGIIYSKDKTK